MVIRCKRLSRPQRGGMDIGTLGVDKTRNARDDAKLLWKQALDPVRALTREFRVNQQETAQRLLGCVRASDTVARQVGEWVKGLAG